MAGRVPVGPVGPAGLVEKTTPLTEKLTCSLEPLLFLLHNQVRGPRAQEVTPVSREASVRASQPAGRGGPALGAAGAARQDIIFSAWKPPAQGPFEASLRRGSL